MVRKHEEPPVEPICTCSHHRAHHIKDLTCTLCKCAGFSTTSRMVRGDYEPEKRG